METGFRTDIGKKRKNNEDSFIVMKENNLFAVADGVGGNNSGEIASKTVTDGIAAYANRYPLKKLKNDKEIKSYFENCIKAVNLHVYKLSRQSAENRGMATTLVMVYIRDGYAYVANVGDSRAYLLRGDDLIQITEDHTYVNIMVKAGLISREEAKHHERKNEITRAIGAECTADADIFKVKVIPGDILLLCTDGLYDELNREAVITELKKDVPVSDICDNLIGMANSHGGNDNITTIVVKVTEEDIK